MYILRGSEFVKRDEIILKYINEIFAAVDKEETAKKIIEEVSGLTYVATNKPISNTDKVYILERLKIEIVNESYKIFSQSDSEHLKLYDMAIKQIKGEK